MHEIWCNMRILCPRFCLGAAIAALLLSAAAPVRAGGADARRLAAEILVMSADARRMFEPGVSRQHRQGLEARLRGGLAIMPLLIRAARRDTPALPPLGKAVVPQITNALNAGNAGTVISALQALSAAYPFDTAGLLPADNRPAALRAAKALHESYCAGCHDEPDLDTARPAWSLFSQAKKIPPAELAARLVIGVRGQPLTAMDNPLRDTEISALITFYRSHQSQ